MKHLGFEAAAPNGRYFSGAGVSFMLSFALFGVGLYEHMIGTSSGNLSVIGAMFCSLIGVVFMGFGTLTNVIEMHKTEFIRQLARQDERVRELESRLAALTPPKPTP